MKLFESLRIALGALLSNKMRAALTMLGIIIGVGAVIGMLALGNGFQGFLTSQFAQLGVGNFYVAPFVDTNRVDIARAARLSSQDAAALTAPGRAPAVAAVAIEYSGNAQIVAGSDRFTFSVRAVNPDFWIVSPQDLGAAGC